MGTKVLYPISLTTTRFRRCVCVRGISDIQKHWDENKTVRENAEKLGISLVANTSIKYSSIGEEPSKSETELVSLLEDRAARGEAPRPDHLPEGEKLVLRRLIGKYGKDYRKMARDMRLNSRQHTVSAQGSGGPKSACFGC
mmetsp:Transcript_19136/g.76682  ORF Transcript_19136/g.76682 Transcript_19136/m.76682 type:complete len:141 (-) Transcript_19136:993-1415(-)